MKVAIGERIVVNADATALIGGRKTEPITTAMFESAFLSFWS